jgi:hypothetical protein
VPLEFCNSEFRVFDGALNVCAAALVINGKLFAGVDLILRIGDHFFPNFCGAVVLATTFRHQRQLSLRPGTNIRRQPDRQCLCARRLRTHVISAALQKSR